MKRLLVCALMVIPMPAWAQQNLLEDVKAERAKHGPSMTPPEVAQMLNAVAWKNRAQGWGLLRKGAGNSCELAPAVFISCDILVHAPSVRHFDVLIDSENRAEPNWKDAGPCVLSDSSGCQMSNFLAPMAPSGQPDQPPIPQPSGDIDAIFARLNARLAEIAEQVDRLRSDVNEHYATMDAVHAQMTPLGVALDSIGAAVRNVGERLGVIEAKPIPTSCSAAINTGFFRAPLSCRLQ